MGTSVTPLSTLPRPISDTESTLVVDPDDRILAGHYPGFPIFPGVCLVETAHQTYLATRPDPDAVTLEGIDSVRFLGPVFPGDEVTTRLSVKPRPDGSLRCTATLSTARGAAATVRLRYTGEVAR